METNRSLYKAPTGQNYLVQRYGNGAVVFTPETPHPLSIPTAPAVSHDRTAVIALAIAGTISLMLGCYALGFFAGRAGRETVIVPRGQVCNTASSSFLGFRSERKDCQ